MGISRFDVIPQSNLSPSELSLPFNEIMNAGMMKQRAYDTNEQQEYQLSALMQRLKADPKADFAKAVVDERYNQRLLELSTTIADKGDMNYRKEINKIAAEYNNDPLVQTIQQRRVNYDKYQEDRIKQTEKGGYVNFYDPYTNEGDIQGAYGQTGQLRQFNYGGMDQRQDYTKRAEELVKGIAESGSLSDAYVRYKEGDIIYDDLGQRRKVTQGFEGVDRTKVQKVALANAEPFLKTQEGRFFMHELVGRGGFEYDNLDTNQKTGFKKEAANYLAKLAEKQIGGKSKFGENLESLSEAQLKSKTTPITENSVVDLGDIPLSNINPELDKLKVQSPESVEDAIVATKLRLSNGGSYMDKEEEDLLRANLLTKEKNFKFSSEQRRLIDKAKRQTGQYPSTSQGEAKLLSTYIDNLKKQSLSNTVVEIVDKDERKNENQFLFGTDESGGAGVTERSIKLIDGEGPKDGRGSDLLKEYGNPKEYSINVSSKLNPGNPFFEAGRVVKVSKKDGEVVARYAISGNSSEKDKNKVAHQFYQTKYDPRGEKEITLGGQKYKLEFENVIGKDGTTKIGEKASLKDSSGNILKTIESETDAIGELYESLRKK